MDRVYRGSNKKSRKASLIAKGGFILFLKIITTKILRQLFSIIQECMMGNPHPSYTLVSWVGVPKPLMDACFMGASRLVEAGWKKTVLTKRGRDTRFCLRGNDETPSKFNF